MNLEKDTIPLPQKIGDVFSSSFYFPIFKLVFLFVLVFLVLRFIKSISIFLFSRVPVKKNRIIPSYQKELILTFWNKIISESFLCRSLIEKIDDILLQGNTNDHSTLVMIYTLEAVDRIDSIVSYFKKMIEPQSLRNNKHSKYYQKYFYIELESTQKFKEKIDLLLLLEVLDLIEDTLNIIDTKYTKQTKSYKLLQDYIDVEKRMIINRRRDKLLDEIANLKASANVAAHNLKKSV